MSTDLCLTSFENALAELEMLCHPSKLKDPEPIDHVVLNCHKLVEDVANHIKNTIKKAPEGHILHGLDLRIITHPQGVEYQWSLEACSRTKSLALVGKGPAE